MDDSAAQNSDPSDESFRQLALENASALLESFVGHINEPLFTEWYAENMWCRSEAHQAAKREFIAQVLRNPRQCFVSSPENMHAFFDEIEGASLTFGVKLADATIQTDHMTYGYCCLLHLISGFVRDNELFAELEVATAILVACLTSGGERPMQLLVLFESIRRECHAQGPHCWYMEPVTHSIVEIGVLTYALNASRRRFETRASEDSDDGQNQFGMERVAAARRAIDRVLQSGLAGGEVNGSTPGTH